MSKIKTAAKGILASAAIEALPWLLIILGVIVGVYFFPDMAKWIGDQLGRGIDKVAAGVKENWNFATKGHLPDRMAGFDGSGKPSGNGAPGGGFGGGGGDAF